jgi:hypothetical protein
MTAVTLEERRRQIAEIKSSFNQPIVSKYRDVGTFGSDTSSVQEVKSGSFMMKALIAIVLFAAFLAFDRSQAMVFQQNSDSVYQMIGEEKFSLETWMEMMEK